MPCLSRSVMVGWIPRSWSECCKKSSVDKGIAGSRNETRANGPKYCPTISHSRLGIFIAFIPFKRSQNTNIPRKWGYHIRFIDFSREESCVSSSMNRFPLKAKASTPRAVSWALFRRSLFLQLILIPDISTSYHLGVSPAWAHTGLKLFSLLCYPTRRSEP